MLTILHYKMMFILFSLMFFSDFLMMSECVSPDDLNKEEETCGAEICSSTTVEEECNDLHELCHGWAAAGECVINPSYMRSACRRSCVLCYDESYLSDSVADKETIKRIKIFSKMDIGENQFIPREPEKDRERVLTILKAMDIYSKVQLTQSDMDSFRHLCTNKDKHCALWASQNQCIANNRYMLATCPLACQMCHALPMFTRCSASETNESKVTHQQTPTATTFNPSSLIQQALLTESLDNEIIVHGDNENPWVVLFNNFLTETSCEALRSTLLENNLLEWTSKEDPPHERYHRHKHQRAKCNKLCDEQLIYQEVTNKISSLFGIDPSNLSFMEIIKLERGESVGAKHDLKPQHTWLPAGPRILTLLLCLAESEGGGAVGFPDLNWTSIKLTKGQMIVWSNVRDSDPTSKQPKMTNELLPVVSGEAIFAKMFVHAYDWKKENARGCA